MLLLELHALTLAARSYALLLSHVFSILWIMTVFGHWMMCSVCLMCIYLCSEGHGGLKIRGGNQEHFSCLAVHIQQRWLIKEKGQLSICANVCISSTDSCHRRANRSVLYQGCSVYALSKNWSVIINILQREKSKAKTSASFYQHMQQTFMIQERKNSR